MRSRAFDMYILSYVISLLFISIVVADEGAPCTTPNGEQATCVTIHSCKVISDAIKYLDKNAIEFAKKSQCGFHGNDPLVCCGSTGRPTSAESPIRRTTAAPLLDIFGEPIRPTTPYVPTSPKPIDNIYLPDNTLCGIQTAKQNRIVGGIATEIDEFPWMVALKYTANDGSDGGYRCGGTLISERYVLTAAQCLSVLGYDVTEVRLGEWRFSTDKDCTEVENEQICADDILDRKIAQKISHPYYSKRSGNNDIALLRLEQKVKYTDYVRPICLPASDLPPPDAGTPMDIAGWGITENGNKSDVKLKVQVPIVSNEDCSKVFTNFTHVNPNQACAGGEGGRDACKGDSGGPLMTKYPKVDETEEEQWYQEGIIYRGLGCGRKNVPGLYARVSRYTNWILNNLK